MNKVKIKEVITTAIKSKEICGVSFKYDLNYRYYFPLLVSDKLFLSANEDDFILDGFTVRRFCDVKKAEIKNNKCAEITKCEVCSDKLHAPEIDITDWYSTLTSLSKMNINMIIEKENSDYDKCEFAIGKIKKVLKTKVIFSHFDADGIWQDEDYEIPYSQITSITFASRYVEIFSKYV